MLYINLYLTNRLYGGPEEGGWWYDAGEPVRSFMVATERRATRIASWVERVARCFNDDPRYCRDLNSVNCEGRYEVRIEDQPAAAYPATRPHYE